MKYHNETPLKPALPKFFDVFIDKHDQSLRKKDVQFLSFVRCTSKKLEAKIFKELKYFIKNYFGHSDHVLPN